MIRRTAAITAASIAGVIIAGGAAVGANVGILNASTDPTFGSLSADGAIYDSGDNSTSSSSLLTGVSDQASQVFSVDAAGTVTIETDGTALRVSDVTANPGWGWTETGQGGGAAIRFTSAEDTLNFHAELQPDGSIVASVERPAVSATATSVTTSQNGSYDYDDDSDDDRDDHSDDHDEDHDEYEGRDDDD